MPKICSTIISKFREPSQNKAIIIDQKIIISNPISNQQLLFVLSLKPIFTWQRGISLFHAKSLKHFAFLRRRNDLLLNKHV